MDWGVGRYENIADSLLPAAAAVVERANPRPGEHVLDLGCGTGNAALIAAERGARVTGVDPAERLLEVAAAEAGERGLRAAFVEGDAASIPVVRGSVDAVVSCFGVIFAPDAEEAAEEIARVTAPRGRVVLSAWIPEGPLGAVMKVGRKEGQPGSAPFGWHDRDALEGLLGPHGFHVELEQHRLAFTADSPQAFFDREVDPHPLWAGDAPARDRALEILTAANEDPAAFRATSAYVVATARRG
jgi:SAM-dependent methyltransferase